MRSALVTICVLAVAACTHPKPKPPVEGRTSPTSADDRDPSGDPVAMLRALAKAAHDDDGAALDRLIHPALGLWLWDQPGAALSPFVQLHAGAGASAKPTSRIAGSGLNDYWQQNYWPSVAAGLDAGLAALDRDPTDKNAAKYGDCGADDASAQDLRAWLALGEDLGYLQQMAEDAQIKLDDRAARGMTHFHAWGLDVYLARDQGRWWIVHVMVSTPCDA